MLSRTAVATSDDETPIRYHSYGFGPPVVLVHGAVSTWEDYRTVGDHLADEHQVVLIERRGYGSPDPGGPATFAQDGKDICAVLAALDAPAVLFGHSAGALAALHAADGDRRRGTAAVSHLCVYEPAGAASIALLDRFHALRAEDPAEALATFIAAGSDASEDQLVAAFRQPAWADKLRLVDGVQRDLTAQVAYPPGTDWSQLDLPTRVLLGERTHGELSRRAHALAQTMPQAELVTLPGQGHLAHMLAPELLAQTLHTPTRAPRPSR